MKRRDDGLRHRQAADDFVHALDHFRGGLVSKSHCQDGLRHCAQILDQMSDAIRYNPRLAATGTGQNEQRPLASFDSFTLLRIELGEKRQEKISSRLVGFYRMCRTESRQPKRPCIEAVS